MSNNFQQAVKVRRVSLQLNSQGSRKTDQIAHNRAILCYSSNLKKRTDALTAQRIGINQFLQKTSSFIKPMPQLLSMKTVSSSISPKRKQKNIIPTTPSQVSQKPQQKGDGQINLQKIEVNAKSMQIKSKRNTICFNELSQNNKNNGDRQINFKTIPVSQTMKSKMITQPPQQSQPSKNIREMIWSAKVTKNRRIQASSNSKNNKINRVKTQTAEQPPIQNMLSSQRIALKKQIEEQIENKSAVVLKNFNEAIKNNNEFLITQIQSKKTILISKIPINSDSNITPKLQKHPISSNQHSIHSKTQNGNKSAYKTNNINLSQHFSQLQAKQRQLSRERQGLFSGFPICKRANMSSFNKYYQNIIQQAKNKEQKLKQQVKQRERQKQRQKQKQKNDNIGQEQQYMELQVQEEEDIKIQGKNKLYKNITINIGNYETVKSISLDKCMMRNRSVQTHNHKITIEGKNERNKNLQIDNDPQPNGTKLIHSIHNNSIKSNNFINNMTNPTVNKNIKMYQNNNMVWFEVSNNKEQNMMDFQIKYTICKKKQLLERPLYADEHKKKVMKNYGKSLGKKCNTQVLYSEKRQQNLQKEEQTVAKLRRQILKNKNQKDQPPLAAWDVLHGQNEAHDQNF